MRNPLPEAVGRTGKHSKHPQVFAQSFAILMHSQIHPVQLTTLYFFAGLSNDTLARGMPNRSPLLSSIIEDAESCYLKAQQTLPAPISTPDSNGLNPIDEQDEAADSSAPSSVRHSLGSQTSTTSTCATSVSGGRNDSPVDWSCESSPLKKPSPLHVRKYSALPQTPSKQLTESTSLFSLVTASSRRSPPRSSSFSLSSPGSSPEKNGADFVHKYNEDLNDFAEMLANHISGVRAYRRNAEAAHDVWRPSNRDGAGSKEMDRTEKTVRIARGKERGWMRTRFDAQRYQDVCEKAIAEL
jgi:hypothetical protein